MSDISFSPAQTFGTTGYVKEARTNVTTDNVVNLDNTDKAKLKEDLKGAQATGTKIFLTHTVQGKTVTEVIDLTKKENKDALKSLMTSIDSPDFKLANVKFTPKTETTTSTTKTETTTSSDQTATTRRVNMKVSDYEQIAKADKSDTQFQKLYEYPQNFITYDPATGKITGAQIVADGETKRAADGNLQTSKTDAPVTETTMDELIVNDFKKYASPPLTELFTNDEKGIKDFVQALKNIPGNANNPNINEKNAKELLSYIHTGKNTSGKVDVKQLQQLLNGLTGKTGGTISDKNNPPGGDDKYGFATTLQVRSLAAMIPKNILSGNPVILVDTSGSMKKELGELTSTMGQIVNKGGTYHIGRFGDTGQIGVDKNNKPVYENDMNWKTDGDNDSKNKVNKGVDAKTAIDGLNKISKEDINKGSNESGIRAGLLALGELEKTSTPENLLMFTDEGDKGLGDLGKLLSQARDKGYRPIIIYHNDTTNKYSAIDLTTIGDKISEYNSKHPDAPLNLSTSFKNGEYQIDWKLVISKLGIPQENQIKDLKI